MDGVLKEAIAMAILRSRCSFEQLNAKHTSFRSLITSVDDLSFDRVVTCKNGIKIKDANIKPDPGIDVYMKQLGLDICVDDIILLTDGKIVYKGRVTFLVYGVQMPREECIAR